ncbi:MAG: ABC transporter substrate-binding protein [Kiritimatiellaeota bacterium]|nr:ABC transporter substrate-binding protein [Kiritimatiellota bacterium]
MLGAEDRLVGVPASVYRDSVAKSYAMLDERLRNRRLPAPGNWDFVNLETVVGLKPDLVILWAAQKETISALEERHIPVYAVEIRSFTDIYREMADFGTLTGTRQRANALITYTQNEVSNVVARLRTSGATPVRTYFMWAQGPLETAGRKSAANELLVLAGATNACPLPDEHVVANLETVMTWNPEVIIMWFNPARKPADIMRMDGWRSMAAVRTNRVHELPTAFLCDFWTLKFQYAVKLAALCCQPQAIPSITLDQELRRMMVTLYGQRGLRVLP